MSTGSKTAESFVKYLASKHLVGADSIAKFQNRDGGSTLSLRKLWELTDLSANDFADEVARFHNLPRMSLADLMAATPMVAGFSSRFLREMMVFPFEAENGGAGLAVPDPADAAPVRAAEIVLGQTVKIRVASFEDVATALAARLGNEEAGAPTVEASTAAADDDIESLRDLASGAPIVRAVNDRLLRPVAAPSGALPQALISRIKILSGLNISERRLPQDGAARLRVARSEIDIRVATMPTQHGESAVIRLLPRDRGLLEFAKLGLSDTDEPRMRRLLNLPHGMIVITGPTGSGKTTTLATMLSMLNEPTRKILTIEDPVEYELSGVNQSQVKPAIGLTFATALRAFVRQDPDVIMVGEVRDSETAHIAIHAALTGHLVLTTLHTETAAAAVPRLIDLGIEGFLLKSTLRAVVAQRLVRVLCDRCKVPHQLTPADIDNDPRFAVIGFQAGEVIHEAGGCERCGGTGYRGRNGVFEILEMSDEVRKLIGPQTDSH